MRERDHEFSVQFSFLLNKYDDDDDDDDNNRLLLKVV